MPLGSSKKTWTCQILVYTDYYDVLIERLNTVKKSREDLLVAGKKVGVEVNAEKTNTPFWWTEGMINIKVAKNP